MIFKNEKLIGKPQDTETIKDLVRVLGLLPEHLIKY